MDKEIPIGSALTVLFLLAILGFYLYSVFHQPVSPDTDKVKYGAVMVQFRSPIKDCYSVPADSAAIYRTFNNPLVQKIIFLMDPYGSRRYGVSVYEAYRLTNFVGKKTVYAVTNATEKGVDVYALEDATVEEPIVFFNMSSETSIRQVPSGIILNAKDDAGLDLAACRFGLALLGDPEPA